MLVVIVSAYQCWERAKQKLEECHAEKEDNNNSGMEDKILSTQPRHIRCDQVWQGRRRSRRRGGKDGEARREGGCEWRRRRRSSGKK